ncbi:hypothetical protein BFJ68_g12593 [Fusarium oxysporum]|uniref:Methyltransferase domain-containing protein n=1 Tax=Fusarium oxysporum TaxID=5507 RepID=A0A420Q7K5_FUSOX|nr:hypothetical protein BFJ68_g12593 [Fusarium oxysporum]
MAQANEHEESLQADDAAYLSHDSALAASYEPNDDEEQDRMDLGHHIYRLVLGGDLFLAPIGDKVKRVLDLGTGTGIWAMDFAEYTFPHP